MTLSIIGVVLVCPILICIGLYRAEWEYHDRRYQNWLNEDEHRVDFNVYADTEEIREALLNRLPPGTPEEELEAFYLANRVQGEWDHRLWQPKYIAHEYGIVLRVWSITRGPLLHRILSGRIIVFLELDPADNSLQDITVDATGFAL